MSKKWKCKFYDICNKGKQDKCFDYILNRMCKTLNKIDKIIDERLEDKIKEMLD